MQGSGGATPVAADDAFCALYEREHGAQVRRAALLVGCVETAHDLVHDAFVEVYRRWATLDDPGPYLNRAVVNRCRDQARRRLTRERYQWVLQERSASPEDASLLDAIGGLPFHQRAVVVLRFYLQCSDRDIAELLGCRPGSIGPWRRRALDRLRRELA